MKTTLACVAASLTLSSCIVVNNQQSDDTTTRRTPEAPQIRGALSGQPVLLATFYITAADCTSIGFPTLKVAKPPKHGQASVEHATAIANFPATDVRNVCNGRSAGAAKVEGARLATVTN